MMCFGPRELQPPQELEAKIQAAAKGWSHDHWPCHSSGNGSNFRGLGSNNNKFVDNAAKPLTEAMRRLMGVRDAGAAPSAQRNAL